MPATGAASRPRAARPSPQLARQATLSALLRPPYLGGGKIFAGLPRYVPQPGEDFSALAPPFLAPIPAPVRCRSFAHLEVAMSSAALPAGLRHESLEVGAAPLVRLFLTRLDLPGLFGRHLPGLPGRPPALPSCCVLCVLLANLLLARRPLYALADWVSRRVPEHLGLQPGQAPMLNDDRAGRALDHLHRADRASLLTALVMRAVTEFDIDLSEQHQDTTTITFSGEYANQAPADQADRPPRIAFGFNKDHRPDLKQLLFSVTISSDGAVPVHCKTYDGNTTDDQVHQEANPRRHDGPDVVYHSVESPQRSSEGYRVLWYRSSQKEEQDRQARAERLRRASVRLGQLRPVGRGGEFTSEQQARSAGQRVLEQEQVQRWLRLHIDEEVREEYRQAKPGRPGPGTTYKRLQIRRYKPRVEEDGAALAREAVCDGLFPLMTNDEGMSLQEALGKYKYQPFVEKRHEQLKSVFGVTPMWLKSAGRVESLLWLYYVVELVQALLEREVRRRMQQEGQARLALYPEGRPSEAPTAGLVLSVLEGHRRHRLLDEQGQELRRFHDPVSDAAWDVLTLLDVDPTVYGLD